MPASNSEFSGWTGDCSGFGCSLTLDADKNVTAVFAKKRHWLAVYIQNNTNGTGRITSTPPAIDCRPGEQGTCYVFIDDGTQVTLHVTPDVGPRFVDWEETPGPAGPCAPGTGDCTFTMDQTKTVRARFGPTYIRPKTARSLSPTRTAVPGLHESERDARASPRAALMQTTFANSPYATLGTPGATDPGSNGGANSIGSVVFTVRAGQPGPPDDSDVLVKVSLTDVRCRPAAAQALCGSANATGGADYIRELFVTAGPGRMTDRANTSWVNERPYADAGTTQDVFDALGTKSIAVQCAATSSTSVGSTCSANTSLNAKSPGFVLDGKRTIMDLGIIGLADGGSDGTAATYPNYYFVTQGLFVP